MDDHIPQNRKNIMASDLKPLPISVCILTRNNEATIERCLAPLSRFEEILVLDTGSTDGTLAILERYPNVTVYHQNGIDHFGDTRNLISAKAKNDWLLHIDSDEFIAETLYDELTALDLDSNTVYAIRRNVCYCGKKLPAFDDWIKRLYNRRQTSWSDRAVHEVIQVLPGMKISRLQSPLAHHALMSIAQRVDKIQKYSTLFADHFVGKKTVSRWRGTVSGIWAFFRSYILSRRFIHGHDGFFISVLIATETFLKYAKLYERNLQSPPSPATASCPPKDI